MSLDALNGFLEVLGLLNDRTNHGCWYELVALESDSASQFLCQAFSKSAQPTNE